MIRIVVFLFCLLSGGPSISQIIAPSASPGKPKSRQIFFDGNSLTNQGAGGVVSGQQYPTTFYSSLILLGKNISYFNFSIGSRRTATLTSEFVTKIVPSARFGDIVVVWEITNEAHDMVDDTNGDALFANMVAYCQQARTYGLRVVCLTGIARDMSGFDDANITSRIMACNAKMRISPSSYCDLLVDVGALPQFDEKSDTANTTYYNSDKTHLTNAGYDLIASAVYDALVASGMLN